MRRAIRTFEEIQTDKRSGSLSRSVDSARIPSLTPRLNNLAIVKTKKIDPYQKIVQVVSDVKAKKLGLINNLHRKK